MCHNMPDNLSLKGKVCLIGGDLRQLYAAEALEGSGYYVSCFGLDTYREGEELGAALSDADAILLPVPVEKGENINFPLASHRLTSKELALKILSYIPIGQNVTVFGGKMPKIMSMLLSEHGFTVFDLCENETFNYLNAVPTAEGAIALSMANTKITIDGSGSLVLGYGRIGKCLSRRLKALGSSVTVAARKEKDRAEAISDGMRATDYDGLISLMQDFDAVYNTVPQTVLTEQALSRLKEGVPVIELASKPGGVDAIGAIRCGTRVISAQSLPGRVAPVTAGRIIARCVEDVLEKGGAV